MISQKHLRKIYFFIAILIAPVFIFQDAHAVGLEVGNGALLLNPGENLYYGVTSASNTNGSFLLFKKGLSTIFQIDYNGNITSNGSLVGSNSYWNLSGNNLFASSTAWNLGIGTVSPRGKLDVGGFYTINKISSNASWTGAPTTQFIPLGTFNSNSNVKVVLNLAGCSFGDSALEYMVNKGYNGVPRVYYMGPSSYGTAPRGLDSQVSFQYEIIGTGSYYLGLNVTGGCNDSSRTVEVVTSVVGGANFSAVDNTAANYTALTAYQYIYNGYEGNVGIGTISPAASLDVTGKLKFTSGGTIYNTDSARWLDMTGTLEDSLKVSGDLFSAGVLQTEGTSRPNYMLGSLGVGTNNPGSKFEVYGGSLKVNGGDINFAMTAGQTATKLVSYSNASGLWMIQPTSQSFILADAVDWDRSATIQYTPGTTGALAGRLMIGQTSKNSANYTHGITSLFTSGVEQLRIISSGNVGIGTVTPDAKLNVNGTFHVTGALNSVVLDRLTGTGNRIVMTDASGSLYATSSSIASGMPSAGALGQTLYSNGSGWVASVSPLYNNGTNVGIGTTNPVAKLNVAGPGNTTGGNIHMGDNTDGAAKWTFLTGAHYNGATNPTGISLIGSYATASDNNVVIGGNIYEAKAATNIQFWTDTTITSTAGGSEKMRILGNGNVGIGSAAPSASLDVTGKLKLTSGGTIYNTDSGRWLDLTGTLTDSLRVSGNIITTGGNVGIGTTNTYGRLDAFLSSNGVRVMTKYLGSPDYGPAIYLSNDAGSTQKATRIRSTYSGAGTASNANFAIDRSTNSQAYGSDPSLLTYSNSFTIDGSNGYVGIGATNPLDLLTIKSPGTEISTIRLEGNTVDTQNAQIIFNKSGTNSLDIRTNLVNAGNRILLSPGASTAMTLLGNGNVGIGTTIPADKLHVSGNATISGIAGCVGTGAVIKTDASGRLVCGTITGGVTGSGTANFVTRWTAPNTLSIGSLYDNGTSVAIGTTIPDRKFVIKGGHSDTTFKMYSTGDGGVNDASLSLWASEPNWTYTGAGIGNNINGSGYYGRLNTNRGASYIRLTDNGLVFVTINSVGTSTTDMSMSDGNVSVPSGNLAVGGMIAANGGLSQDGNTILNGSDTWLRTTAETGWYNSTYGGGLYMTDSTYIRNYNSKPLYIVGNSTNSAIFTSGNVGVGSTAPSASLDVSGKLKLTSGGTIYNTDSSRWLDMTGVLSDSLRVSGNIVTTAGKLEVAGSDSTVFEAAGFYNTYNYGDSNKAEARINIGKIENSSTRQPMGSIGAFPNTNTDSTYGTMAFYTRSSQAMVERMRITSSGNVGIGTTDPSIYKLYVNDSAYINGSLTLAADANINMSGNGKLTVNKLQVNTIDPLYNIKGVNYSTFATSIAGGVKEEITGKVNIDEKVGNEYQSIIDFDNQKVGSDLWVWHSVIDYSKDNVEALITPYGQFANVYYSIDNNKFIFHSNVPTEVSYRLIAKRFDWREWPTRAKDQKEKAGFILK